jgi:hypothetical protein
MYDIVCAYVLMCAYFSPQVKNKPYRHKGAFILEKDAVANSYNNIGIRRPPTKHATCRQRMLSSSTINLLV